MTQRVLEAADRLADDGISAEVINVRSLVPLDTKSILESVVKTNRLYTVEENQRLCGWGAEVSSIVTEDAFWNLDGPVIRSTTPHIPIPAAALEDMALPSVSRIHQTVTQAPG
jgi:pyruvate dehydrogenase E1 component beta subunit